MASTFGTSAAIGPGGGWRSAGLRYFSYSHFLRQRFGHRVRKLSVDAGFTCPNVDGSLGVGGCVFCENSSFSPSRRLPLRPVRQQIEDAIGREPTRQPRERFLAYFQPATNTYAPLGRLRSAYEEALAHPQIVGLVIGTRPDCAGNDVLDLLAELAERAFVCVQYGLQSIHDRSLDWMNRGHHYDAFLDAVARSRGRGFMIGAHVILGLPGESHEDMMATAREVARLGLDSLKLHNLHAVRNTRLTEQVSRGEVRLMDLGEYVRAVVDFLELLPPSVVIERLVGDAPPAFLVGPSWCLDKPRFYRGLQAEMERRDTWQGKKWAAGPSSL